MKMQFAGLAVAAVALAAGPAAAQGTFSPNNHRPAAPASPSLAGAYHAPAPPAAPKPPAAPSMAAPGGFKPYEPYKGSSVYSAPKPAHPGAKPCETSVYVNACGPGH